jgi:hypothetical protein
VLFRLQPIPPGGEETNLASSDHPTMTSPAGVKASWCHGAPTCVLLCDIHPLGEGTQQALVCASKLPTLSLYL